ncbi:hypothetical protein NL676_007919 [Syzygium grande]|nr:hypothetical protein NL676_007919 [Syzygium grande]
MQGGLHRIGVSDWFREALASSRSHPKVEREPNQEDQFPARGYPGTEDRTGQSWNWIYTVATMSKTLKGAWDLPKLATCLISLPDASNDCSCGG